MINVMIAFNNAYNEGIAIKKLENEARLKELVVETEVATKFQYNPGPTFTNLTIGNIVKFYMTHNVYTRVEDIEEKLDIVVYESTHKIINNTKESDGIPTISISNYDTADDIAVRILDMIINKNKTTATIIKKDLDVYEAYVHKYEEDDEEEDDVEPVEPVDLPKYITISSTMHIPDDLYDEAMSEYYYMTKHMAELGIAVTTTTISEGTME